MREVSVLSAFSRELVGTNSSKKIRQEKKVPAIIYGDGKTPEPIALQKAELRVEINKTTFLNKLYDLSIKDKKVRVIVQSVSQNPVTDELEHIDFLRVNDNTKVTIEVPVNFINDSLSPGIKRGGVLNIVRYSVEVICPVKKIPDSFEFDLNGLEIGDSIHISHTNIEEGIEPTIKDRDFTVASILAPSALVSSDSAEDKEEDKDEDKDGDKDGDKEKTSEEQEKK